MVQSRPIRGVLTVLACAAALLGGRIAVMALIDQPRQWIALSFGVVVVVASVFLGMLALGLLRRGQAITLLCVAGATGVGSVFAVLSAGRPLGAIRGDWWTLAGLGLAGVLVLLAALEVLMRRPWQSWPRFLIGVGILLPLGVLLVLARGGAIATLLGKGGMGFEFAGYALLLVLGIGLLAAGGHQIISAFQIGVRAMDEAAGSNAGQEGIDTQDRKGA